MTKDEIAAKARAYCIESCKTFSAKHHDGPCFRCDILADFGQSIADEARAEGLNEERETHIRAEASLRRDHLEAESDLAEARKRLVTASGLIGWFLRWLHPDSMLDGHPAKEHCERCVQFLAQQEAPKP